MNIYTKLKGVMAIRHRVRYKQQMADTDCGPACLAMILGFYHYNIPVSEARELCENAGPPQSARSIIAAARSLCCSSDLVAVDIPALRHIRLPCILHWSFNHFVVLNRINRKTVSIVDPALGYRSVTLNELDLAYTGIAIVIEPKENFKPRKSAPNREFVAFLRNTIRHVGLYKSLMLIVITAIAIQGVSMLSPLLLMYITNVVLKGHAYRLLEALLPLIVIAGVSVLAVTYLRSRVIVILQMSIDVTLLTGFFSKLMRLPVPFYLDHATGDIQNRMNSSTIIREALSSGGISTIMDVIMSIAYIIAIIFVAPAYAGLTVIFASLDAMVAIIQNKSIVNKMAAEVQTQSAYQSCVQEAVSGVVTIKACGSQLEIKKLWDLRLKNYLISSTDRRITESVGGSLSSALHIIAPAVLLWFSVLQYLHGSLDLGVVLAINTMSAMAMAPLSGVIGSYRLFQMTMIHGQRFGDIWRYADEHSGSTPCPPLVGIGDISFDRVSFRYRQSASPTITNLSFSIPIGSKVGIVGPSGSGKSTLASLILGLFKTDAGTISVCGIPLDDIDLASYRSKVGYVSEQTFLFDSSVRNNVSLSKPMADLSEVEAALTAAQLLRDVQQMPMGLETVVGNNGSNLSGGQRQRLAIARALLGNPNLLILDEATSNLDTVTEACISDVISRNGCTQVIIAHRLSTIINCDVILVMNNGCIVDSGRHAELLARCTYYRDSWIKQTGIEISEKV